MNHTIANIRNEYSLNGLLETDLNLDPLQQFKIWFDEAVNAGITEPNAMHLSTVYNGRPSGRIVLLKDLDSKGFVFFTNYNSRKGRELAIAPFVALTFFWKEFERQVRVEGRVVKTTEKESDDYFAIRPHGSQIGAWVSDQSEYIADKEVLEKKTRLFEAKFNGISVPRPPHWGGYRVIPEYFEFWQGRPSRLHDRLIYKSVGNGSWKNGRLSP